MAVVVSYYPRASRDFTPRSTDQQRLPPRAYTAVPRSDQELEDLGSIERRVGARSDINRVRQRVTEKFNARIQIDLETSVREYADRFLAARPELMRRPQDEVYELLLEEKSFVSLFEEVEEQIKALVDGELDPIEQSFRRESAQFVNERDKSDRAAGRSDSRKELRNRSRSPRLGHNDEPIRSPRPSLPARINGVQGIGRSEPLQGNDLRSDRQADKQPPAQHDEERERSAHPLPVISDEDAISKLIEESRSPDTSKLPRPDGLTSKQGPEPEREFQRTPPRGPRIRTGPKQHETVRSPAPPSEPKRTEDKRIEDRANYYVRQHAIHHERAPPIRDSYRPSDSRGSYDWEDQSSQSSYGRTFREPGSASRDHDRGHPSPVQRPDERSARHDDHRSHTSSYASSPFHRREERAYDHPPRPPDRHREAPPHVGRYVPGQDGGDRRRR